MRSPSFYKLAILVSTLLLGACGDGNVQSARQWMDEVRRNTKTAIKAVSPPKQFVPAIYSGSEKLDPFGSQKMRTDLTQKSNAPNGVEPDVTRKKELLENFPLDTIKMVGVLEKPGMRYALITVDKTLYKVKVGNYLGQNFGLITKISDVAIELKEIVQDEVGEWVERNYKLELQGGK